ncbi:MAG: hypothetical protein HY579_03010 [Nitrospinae bacterium]|nr:hypothetical protein [Nitrospinota bacterium]
MHMVICFDATHEAKRALDALIETGQFKDISEAVSMALVNYEVIQRAVKECRQMSNHEIATIGYVTQRSVQNGQNEGTHPGHQVTSSPQVTRHIPMLFQLKETRPHDELLLPDFSDSLENYKNIGPKDWFFGQWNRFLPAKATCRALLNITYENQRGISINEVAGKISYAACELGDYLQMFDARRSSRREESLAAAFPSTGSRGAKSRLRYGNQFVGTMKQGKLMGLPSALQLAGLDSAKDPNLLLTQAGLQFATFSNPILDGTTRSGYEKLSKDEIQFLIQHIQRSVPKEVSAYIAIIDAIEGGASTPEKMDSFLRARFGLQDERSMTATFLTTQRTGAISRMADLGLVGRKKDGLRVTYHVSQPGKYFRRQIP